MEKKHFLLIVALIIILSAVILRVKSRIDNQNSLSKIEKNTISSTVVIEDEAASSSQTNEELKADEPESAPVYANLLISRPQSGELITSPLLVQGKISGTWFFEASLPIKLVDNEENILATSYAMAEGDWMTEAPVFFSGILDFSIPVDLESGYLVISKDNPSGLPENDGSVRMPVRFK